MESTSRIIVRDTLYKIVHFVSPAWITTHSSAESGSERFVNLVVIYRCIYITAVENYLAKSKDGSFGITGEGTLLDNAAGKLNITSGLGIFVLQQISHVLTPSLRKVNMLDSRARLTN